MPGWGLKPHTKTDQGRLTMQTRNADCLAVVMLPPRQIYVISGAPVGRNGPSGHRFLLYRPDTCLSSHREGILILGRKVEVC